MYGWNVNVAAKPLTAKDDLRARQRGAVAANHGLIAGTRVASNTGWRAVEALGVGDKVLTFDNGVQRIVDIQRKTLWPAGTEVTAPFWPVTVPVGALGNMHQIVLLPDQGVMLESEAASDPMGDPFAILPAQALEGLCGIYRQPPQHPVELITLFFADEEVIYVDGGLLVHCPRSIAMLHDAMSSAEALYAVMSLSKAQDILSQSTDVRRALVQGAGYVFGATEMVLVA